MHILIAGGTGLIGRSLVTHLSKNHQISVIGRNEKKLKLFFNPPINCYTWHQLEQINAQDYEVVINLCGHNIATSRWSDKIKAQLIESRVKTNQALIKWIIKCDAKPHYLSASAIGIYGMQAKEDLRAFDETCKINTQQPIDFLSKIGVDWEQSLQPAIDYGLSVTITRFGVVLKKSEGMLKKLAPSFHFGLGSIVSDGKQVISWIDIDDLIAAMSFLIEHPKLTGAFNLTSPNPVSQADFAKLMGKTLHRPVWLTTPAWVIRVLFGEMGECLLNQGQRVTPKRLLEAGFEFQYADLSKSLAKHF